MTEHDVVKTDLTATDELRRLLDERGVKYETDDAQVSEKEWYYVTYVKEGYDRTWVYEEPPDCDLLISYNYDLGAEDAIAATLGSGTCHMEYCDELSGDELYPTQAYVCSACRYVTVDGKTNYCPQCGAKVVDA